MEEISASRGQWVELPYRLANALNLEIQSQGQKFFAAERNECRGCAASSMQMNSTNYHRCLSISLPFRRDHIRTHKQVQLQLSGHSGTFRM
jgi:hypothetical protein